MPALRIRLFVAAGIVVAFLLAAGCATAGRASARRAPSFPPAGVVTPPGLATLAESPERAVSFADRIELAGRVDPRRSPLGTLAWIVAVPPGEFTLTEKRIVLRDVVTAERLTAESANDLGRVRNAPRFRKAFALAELGVLRRVRLLALRVEPETYVTLDNRRYVIDSFEVEIGFPKWTPVTVDDGPFTDRSHALRRMLESAVCNPGALDHYAQRDPAGTPDGDWEPAGWRPLPDSSPGFEWLKIPVAETGLYAIDGRWLAAQGLDAQTIDPADLRILSRGGEVPLMRLGPPGASFGGGARLLFWARRNDSIETNERVYWLGRRAPGPPAEGFAATLPEQDGFAPLDRFNRVLRVEKDESLQTKLGSFLSIREMNWVWSALEPGRPFACEFDADGLPEPVPAGTGRVILYTTESTLPQRIALSVSLNGAVVLTDHVLSGAERVAAFDIPAGLLRRERNELIIEIDAAAGSRRPAALFLDAIEIEKPSLLKAHDGRLDVDFSRTPGGTGPRALQAVGFRPNRLLAFDITDPSRPLRLPVAPHEGDATVHAALLPDTRILLIEDDRVERAPGARRSKWRDWHDAGHGADVLLVHHEKFAAEAADLAGDLRAAGHETLLVDVESIYEDFSCGELSTDAIRAFARHAARHWSRKPGTLLLFGDCTSDGQRIARNDVANYVPTRVLGLSPGSRGNEYASDAFFGWATGEDEIADLFVGRVSVASNPDAREVVRKIREYRALGPQEWTGRALLVADSGDFTAQSRAVLRAGLPDGFDARLLDTAAVPWEDNFYLPPEALEGEVVKVSPVATREIQDAFEEGQALLSFFGHGSPNIWSNQRVWFGGDSENSDNLRLRNGSRLPFVVTWTCNNGAIDYPVPRWNVTIIEDMMRIPGGGAIGAFVPSGPGYARNHRRLADGLYRAFAILGIRDFGALSEMSRLSLLAATGPSDHTQMYILLGDPTLSIPPEAAPLRVEADSPPPGPGTARQRIAFRVSAADALTSATAVLKDPDGTALARAEWLPARPGETCRISFDAPLPVNFADFALQVTALDAAGTLRRGGTRLHRSPSAVVIEAFEQQPEDPGAAHARVIYRLHNRAYTEATVEMRVERLTADGSIPAGSREFTIGPRDRIGIPFDIDAPRGAVVLRADVLAVDARDAGWAHHTTGARDILVRAAPQAESPPELILAPGSLRVLPAEGHLAQPRIEAGIANLGSATQMARLHWTAGLAGGENLTGTRAVGRLGAASSTTIAFPLPIGLQLDDEIRVEARVTCDEQGEGEHPGAAALAIVVAPRDLPDLRAVPGTVRVRPAHLAEGLTLFVECEVENIGGGVSSGCRAGLFAEDDTELRRPLRSIPEVDRDGIPPLPSRGRWPVSIRWDPTGAIGPQRLQLVVDADRTLLESDKSNNHVVVPVEIRSKWLLRSRGIQVSRGVTPGTVRLTAHVANDGQTDAQQVSIWFYSGKEQTKESQIGEVLVDRIPAGGVVEVPFDWDVRRVDLSAPHSPSFAMALRGSLQRISSVSE